MWRKMEPRIGGLILPVLFLKDFSKHLLSLDDLKPEHFLCFFTVFSEKTFDNVKNTHYIICYQTKNLDHSGLSEHLFKPQKERSFLK